MYYLPKKILKSIFASISELDATPKIMYKMVGTIWVTKQK